MKIRVFKPTDVVGLRGAKFESDDPMHHERVRVVFEDWEYELAVNNGGRLELRVVGGGQLTVRPTASNTIEVSVDPWGGRESIPAPSKRPRRRSRD